MNSPALTAERTLRFRDWSTLRYSLLWAYQGPVLAQAHRGSYTSPDASCWLIRKGKVQLSTEEQTLEAGENQWAFVSIPTRFQEFSADAEILSLHFHLSWPGRLPVVRQPFTVVFDAERFPKLEQTALPLIQHVRQAFTSVTLPFLPEQPCTLSRYLRVQNLLPAWLGAYLAAQAALGNPVREPGRMDERILKGIAELDRKPIDQRYSEADLVRQVGLGRTQFNAIFHTAVGMSPRRYFEQRRQEEAATLLTHTELSIKEIALTLGFRYESHFTVWFRCHYRQTPSAYRRNVQRCP
ncbi:MAG: helix-turn-helix domain-containing protein [Chthoniobacteraceae bacterium]